MSTFSPQQVAAESERLYSRLQHVGFGEALCTMFAPLTLEINTLKQQKNAVILAHSYQTPDIMYGIGDVIGDSYQLSKKAQETHADIIVFCGVRFMAETAKILNPHKTVLLPASTAGCSLADSITGEDVRRIKAEHPGVPVVSYVNTSADVKAESDVCCTSSNALRIVESLAGNEVIFLPDELMGKNLQKLTSKKLITWKGHCIVHEDFKAEKIMRFRKKHEGLKVLAHTECTPDVVEASDFAGGTEGMIRYIEATEASAYMLVTECGLNDRMKAEFPEKEFIGMCGLCPYMKQNTLALVLQALKNPKPEQVIEIDTTVCRRAEKSLLKMFELNEKLVAAGS